MTYVHFDLPAIETKMRAMREAARERCMAAATSDAQRAGYEAQDSFFEVQLEAQLLMLGLISEGRSSGFIGTTVGAVLGNIMVNTISAAPDPIVCLNRMTDAMSRAMAGMAGDVEGLMTSTIEVHGDTGGRA